MEIFHSGLTDCSASTNACCAGRQVSSYSSAAKPGVRITICLALFIQGNDLCAMLQYLLVMADQDDDLPSGGKLLHLKGKLQGRLFIQFAEGFIQYQQVEILVKRTCECYALTLSATD